MNRYKVTITETFRMVVAIKAKNQWDACKKAERKWIDSEYILDPLGNFKSVNFTADPIIILEHDYER